MTSTPVTWSGRTRCTIHGEGAVVGADVEQATAPAGGRARTARLGLLGGAEDAAQ
jgi:hypothetical protein